jgi:peptide/nickel transport system substrate-binding protein
VSNTPGVELAMEACEGCWRKVPSAKRIVFKSVTESTTRVAMLIDPYPYSAPSEELRLKKP